jgi:hypothetical protein
VRGVPSNRNPPVGLAGGNGQAKMVGPAGLELRQLMPEFSVLTRSHLSSVPAFSPGSGCSYRRFAISGKGPCSAREIIAPPSNRPPAGGCSLGRPGNMAARNRGRIDRLAILHSWEWTAFRAAKGRDAGRVRDGPNGFAVCLASHMLFQDGSDVATQAVPIARSPDRCRSGRQSQMMMMMMMMMRFFASTNPPARACFSMRQSFRS